MELNEQQEAAVKAIEDKVLVYAGPGAGKTRILTERLRGCTGNTVAITFTNKAADEMKSRCNKGFVGTIHSFANRLVKGEHKVMGSEELMGIRKEQIALICNHMNYEDYIEMCKISSGKSLKSKEEYSDKAWGEWISIENSDISSYMKAMGLVSFDDLLKMEHEKIDIDHLLVDEFQDVGELEFNFLMSLKARNYFFVGDVNQSIYGFKGSDSSIMQNLDAKKYNVTINYRNPKKVYNKACELINAPMQTKDGGYVQTGNKFAFKYYLRDLRRNSDDWMVLCRTNRDVIAISNVLENENIKAKVMTVHASKGLESKNVLYYGDTCCGKRPKWWAKEELNVSYVAYTRASEKLIILS